MKKFILDLTVKSNVCLSPTYTLLILTADDKLPPMRPGQFVQLRVDGTPATFLRRPFSIHQVDEETNELWLLVQQVGNGTRQLARLQPADRLNAILPLGHGFSMPPRADSRVLMVGGGCGIAPLLFLGATLRQGGYDRCDFLLGAKNNQGLLQLNEFAKYGTLYTATEDGSHGHRGLVTEHPVLKQMPYDRIYTCGPTPMMKAVALRAQQSGVYCEVSLENTMACGIGACLCCVTNTTDGHLCVCTEGPVFNSECLKW